VLLNRGLHDAYVEALVRSIRHHVPTLAEKYSPIGINWGGGTPTLLAPTHLRAIAGAFRPEWNLADMYFSVEATPDSLSDEVLAALRDIGVNRLSVGAESFNDATLRRMGRCHSAVEAMRSIERAQRHGFKRFSLDLILGYPGETVDDTVRSVDAACSLGTAHMAALLYSPVENSALVRSLQRDPRSIWTDSAYATGVAQVGERLEGAGYRNHEYFHWTRPPHDSDYVSLDYYFGHVGDVFGFGSGVHSFIAPKGCLITEEMPAFLGTPTEVRPGPVNLEFALERSLGCQQGLRYEALAHMFGVSREAVETHPIASAFRDLEGVDVHQEGVRIRRDEYLRQYVVGVQRRLERLCGAAGAR
jgi:coproporphyrinogen III oxidase-like Fe-S oxidoreductase